MRTILLAVLLALAGPAPAADCPCLQRCTAQKDLAKCQRACAALCASDAKRLDTLRTGHLGGLNDTLSDEELKRLPARELDEWEREYRRRREEFMGKCDTLTPSDPNYQTIHSKCLEGDSNIAEKVKSIQEEKARRKAEEAAKHACDRAESMPDAEYCVKNCGPCERDHRGTFVRSDKAERKRAAARAQAEKRRKAAEQAAENAAPTGGTGSCPEIVAAEEASCAGLTEKTTPTRAACLAGAKRRAKAQCAGLRNIKANEGNR
jgi:hypothetical protein